MNTQKIHQGDVLGPILIRPDIDDNTTQIDASWVCKVAVIDKDGGPLLSPRNVADKTSDELYFALSLTPDETADFPVNMGYAEYYLVIQVENATHTPVYKKEKHIPLYIMKQGII